MLFGDLYRYIHIIIYITVLYLCLNRRVLSNQAEANGLGITHELAPQQITNAVRVKQVNQHAASSLG